MPKISKTVIGQGTDTARVEKLRELMEEFYRRRFEINGPAFRDDEENRLRLIRSNYRVTLNRISNVLDEDWNGKD